MSNTIDIHITIEESSKLTTYENSEIKNSIKLLFEIDNYGLAVNIKNINLVPINPEFRKIPFNFIKSIKSGKSHYTVEFRRSQINLNKCYFEFLLENSIIKSNEINFG